MVKYPLFVYVFAAFLLYIPSCVNAATSNVTVRTEGNSSASVSVKNSVTSSSTSTNSLNTKTDIRVETDGEVQEYHSRGNDNVTIESGNGTNSVRVTNDTAPPSEPSTPDYGKEKYSLDQASISGIPRNSVGTDNMSSGLRRFDVFMIMRQVMISLKDAFMRFMHF